MLDPPATRASPYECKQLSLAGWLRSHAPPAAVISGHGWLPDTRQPHLPVGAAALEPERNPVDAPAAGEQQREEGGLHALDGQRVTKHGARCVVCGGARVRGQASGLVAGWCTALTCRQLASQLRGPSANVRCHWLGHRHLSPSLRRMRASC